MRYRITGIDASSTKPVEIVIDAADEAAARADASRRGIRAERVERDLDPGPRSEPVLVRLEPGQTVLVELTAKRWKALLMISLLLLTLGVLFGGYAVLRDPRSLSHPPLLAWIGGAIALIGLFGVLVARLGAWWKHG